MESIRLPHYQAVQTIQVFKATDDSYYLESFKVRNGKLLEGRPLTQSSLVAMAKAVLKKNTEEEVVFSGLIPKGLIHFSLQDNNLDLAWVCEAGVNPILFSNEMNIKSGKIKHPRILFRLINDNLSIRLLQDGEFNLDTTLCYAPYPNVDRTGSVCLGSAKLRASKHVDKIILAYQNAFFNSLFSHINSTLIEVIPYNILGLWDTMVSNQSHFPEDKYIPCNETISEFLGL